MKMIDFLVEMYNNGHMAKDDFILNVKKELVQAQIKVRNIEIILEVYNKGG